ncbi:hypothetical protein N431DRAFT_439698 [Stipitochalara longipes BDJ]|nr:hypothetical protein N431DRAFT_439698 [Stipitochalara longipes BDJ]
MTIQGSATSGSVGSTCLFPASANHLLLPQELLLRIIDYLLPTGRVTTLESWADTPQLNRSLVESRAVLCNICHVSRQFNAIATSFLYKVVVLKNRRELLCFFRTLLSARHLRPLVSSFAWVGTLSGLGTRLQQGEPTKDEEMERVISQCWSGIDWPPASAEDVFIVRRLNLDPTNPRTFRAFQILGAILGMVSQLKSLFTLLGSVSDGVIQRGQLPECPELLSIGRLLAPETWMYGSYESANIVDPPPISLHILQSLQTITLEPHSERNTQIYYPTPVLELISRFCPCLERIEIKGINHWRIMFPDDTGLKPELVNGNAKELILRRAWHPQGSIPVIGSVFPNLRRLYAEWDDGSSDTLPGFQWPTDRDICKGLSKMKQTLEVLHLTTTPGSSWQRSNFPSLLSPALGRMTALKHLTTETLWLFGKINPSALDIESLLPSSLVSLHLVDYWGVSEGKEFYLDFSDGSSPLEFLTKTMRHLHIGCYTSLSKLKAVRLTSPYFSCFFGGGTQYGLKEDGYRKDVQDFIDNSLQSFGEVSVEFSVAPYDSLEAHGQWPWSHISSLPLII